MRRPHICVAALAALIAGTTAGKEVDVINNNLKTPYSDQFSLGIRNKVGDWNTDGNKDLVITYDGQPSYAVSVMELEDGKVTRETQYFGDAFAPGPSRAEWVERSV